MATVIDLRSRRIPNWLTWPTILIGLAFHAFVSAPPTPLQALLSGLFGAAIFLPMYWLGGIGGGDAKLAIGLCCLMGSFDEAARLLLYTTISGAVYALLAAARRGQLGRVFRRLVSKEARQTTEPVTFAYAPAFLFGALIELGTLLLHIA